MIYGEFLSLVKTSEQYKLTIGTSRLSCVIIIESFFNLFAATKPLVVFTFVEPNKQGKLSEEICSEFNTASPVNVGVTDSSIILSFINWSTSVFLTKNQIVF